MLFKTKDADSQSATGEVASSTVRLTMGRLSVKGVSQSSRKYRQGTAVAEFAVVAPVFILLVFGMIEFGRAVMVQQVLVNASREGARQAVLDGTTVSEVDSRIQFYLNSANINGADTTYSVNGTTVSDPTAAAGFGDAVTVTISVPFDNVSYLPVPQYIGGTNLTASSVMRRETSQ
jgi:Flp pilus assembly protein TadG